MRFLATLSLAFGLIAGIAAGTCAASLECPGPDGSARLLLATDAEGHLVYSVLSRGRPRLELAPAGVIIDNADFGAGVTLGTPNTRVISEVFPWRGNKTLATNHCRAYEIPVRSPAGNWTLEVRVFNDGAALKGTVPISAVTAIGSPRFVGGNGDSPRVSRRSPPSPPPSSRHWPPFTMIHSADRTPAAPPLPQDGRHD